MAKVTRQAKTKDGYWITEDGTAVTPEVEERWSEECERGFALARWKRRPVGRPPSDRKAAAGRITVRVPRELHEAAGKKAEEERRSIGHLAREALERFVEG